MGSIWRRIWQGRPKVYQQRKWTDDQLLAQGFAYYKPIKQVTLVRVLPASEAPLIIKTPYDTITAHAGFYIAYVAGTELRQHLHEYEPRPIEPHIFEKTYLVWDDPAWKPSTTQAHLLTMGCKPYYKIAGVWAKHLREDTYVQSIESSHPSLAPVGAWLCVGIAGEPWSVTDAWFRSRYVIPHDSTLSV